MQIASPMITTSTIRAPELVQFLEVMRAIKSVDQTRLDEVRNKATDLAAYLEDVHHCLGHGSFDVRIDQRGPQIENNALLWMMPIVTQPEAAAPSNVLRFQEIIHDWMGRHQAVSTLAIFPVLEHIASLSPTDTHALLQFLLHLREEAPFKANPDVSTIAAQARVPTLRFMVGTASRINALPALPQECQPETLDRLALEMKFLAANGPEHMVPDGLILGAPQAYAQAVVSGYSLWLSAVERTYDIDSWTVDPTPVGDICFTIAALPRESDGPAIVVPTILPHWLIGSSGYSRLWEVHGRWPMLPNRFAMLEQLKEHPQSS